MNIRSGSRLSTWRPDLKKHKPLIICNYYQSKEAITVEHEKGRRIITMDMLEIKRKDVWIFFRENVDKLSCPHISTSNQITF